MKRVVIGIPTNKFEETTAIKGDSNIEIVKVIRKPKSLPSCLNEIAKEVGKDDYVIFVHDDVFFKDVLSTIKSILNGFEKYDIIGCVGSYRFAPWLPVWVVDKRACRGELLQGQGKRVGQTSFSKVKYGNPGSVVVIDGFLMAVKGSVFEKIKFDERFGFHLYDMDFCLQSFFQGFKIGVVDMGEVFHESLGDYGSMEWVNEVHKFILKWRDKLDNWVEKLEE